MLAQCDGATIAPTLQREGRETISLSHRGTKADLNISVPLPTHELHGRVDATSLDLLMIGAYAFGIDQQVPKHYEADVHGDKWRRDIVLCLPVHRPELWSSREVVGALAAILGFATDDAWSLHFTQVHDEPSPNAYLEIAAWEAMDTPDQVVLLSGGLDSACALIEQHTKYGRRPLVVSHSPAFHLTARQDHVRDYIAQHFRSWGFPQIPVAIHRSDGTDPVDYTMRSRAFLFAAMGSMMAVNVGVRDVVLADNGVVSLNLPIGPQIIGAHASRSTHPRFIRLFNALTRVVFGDRAPVVQNPLWARTRAEVLEILKDSSSESLITETISCSHVQGLTSEQPQCGVCSQCIDRRMGTEAAGLQQFDPPEKYKTNVFVDSLPNRRERTTAIAYVRRAHALTDAPPEQMVRDFPELFDALPPAGSDQADVARDLTSMLGRHGREVTAVVRQQLHAYSDRYLRAKLPSDSLIVLLGGRGQSAPLAQGSVADGHRPAGRGFGLLLDCWMTCGGLDELRGAAEGYDAIAGYLAKHAIEGVTAVPRERFSAARSYGRKIRREQQRCGWHRHPESVPADLVELPS